MKKLLLIMALSISALVLNAQEIGDWDYVDCGDYKFECEIISLTPPECKLDAAWIYSEDAEIVIPSSVSIDGNEYAVVDLDASFNLGKSIYIPKTIRTISSLPISYSTITKVIFENNSQLTKLNHSTFADALSLTSVDFGDDSQLTEIEGFVGRTGVFHNCTSLTNVDFGKNSKLIAIGGGTETAGGCGVFSDCTSLKNICIPSSVTKLGAWVFDGCTSLTDIEFDDNSNLDTIYFNAFNECSALKKVDLSKCSKLKFIDSYVFDDCTSLENIKFSNSIEEIDILAFNNCISLKSIDLSQCSKLKSIVHGLFADCSSLEDVKLPNTIEEIGYSTFHNCISLKNINLLQCSKLKYINSSVFENCQSLVSIELPMGIEKIEDSAFENCSSLQNINLMNCINLDRVERNAFSGCIALQNINFSNTKLNGISYNAFGGCVSLADVVLPSSISEIEGAFENCSNLRIVKCYAESVPTMYGSVFDGCPEYFVIYVPASSVELYKSDFNWGQYTIKPLEDLNVVEFVSENEINIYPNPAKDNLFIETDVEIEDVCVYDINGILVYKGLIYDNTLDVVNLNCGVYFVKVKINNKEIVKYFVKE